MIQFRLLAALAALPLMSGAVLAQNNGVSTSVTAGPLHGQAQAGPVPNGHTKDNDDQDQARRDPDCTERGVTVQSPNGSSSASASVSSSSSGSTVVAGGGSPGSRTTYSECGRTVRPSKDGDIR